MDSQNSKTSEHFSNQAEAYASSISHAQGTDLDILEQLAQPVASDICLDIATGPGHTALRIAPKAGFVVGVDIAEGMIKKAAELAGAQGCANLLFQVADAHILPFASNSFSLVTCRIAPHHFYDVAKAMREVARVLKPGGRFVLEDSLSPEDPVLAAFLDKLERSRDATHIKSLSLAEWNSVLQEAGLYMTENVIYEKSRSFVFWSKRAGLSDEQISQLSKQILSEPLSLLERFFDIEDGQLINFKDEKLICRAEIEKN
jgi:ubiquinone/menaquinone biosynthesis C-methylase UbiE